jgi:thiol-disulfide isomerase/thioredoxin
MKKILYIIIGLLILGGVVFLIFSPGKPSKLDTFAQCIKKSGATFYGAFWCPHCQAQKAEFGNSAKYLPYIECSTPDGQGQTQICKDADINTYPTWQFGQSTTTRIIGEVSLENLASSTGCVLSQ